MVSPLVVREYARHRHFLFATKRPPVARNSLMFDRPSFDPRYSHGQQAGGSSVRPQSSGIPAMFLPNYAGDGHGKAQLAHAGQQSDGFSEELPMWSGDGRRQVANPMMPVFQANGHRPHHRSHHHSHPAGSTQPPQVLPASGDGRGSVDLSGELSMTVNPVTKPAKKAKKRRAKKNKPTMGKTERTDGSETWKLVALVVIFMIWISGASTLLFLYMDRYLFP